MWQQITFKAAPKQVEDVSELLENLGAVAITATDAGDEPILEPEIGTTPLWQDIKITVLFPHEMSLSPVINSLKMFFSTEDFAHEIEELAEQDWQRVCMQDFHPMQFGENLWVCPSWEQPVDPDAINIMLDPGLAFGSGTHETTTLCLNWLAEHDLTNLDVLDYGCGSGILAIAAIKSGAKHAWAVDIDEQALYATSGNAEKNVINMQQLTVSTVKNLNEAILVDVIMANILAQPLISLVADFSTKLKPSGRLILSGILCSQSEQIKKAYATTFSFVNERVREDWLCLEFSKKV